MEAFSAVLHWGMVAVIVRNASFSPSCFAAFLASCFSCQETQRWDEFNLVERMSLRLLTSQTLLMERKYDNVRS